MTAGSACLDIQLVACVRLSLCPHEFLSRHLSLLSRVRPVWVRVYAADDGQMRERQ